MPLEGFYGKVYIEGGKGKHYSPDEEATVDQTRIEAYNGTQPMWFIYRQSWPGRVLLLQKQRRE